MCNCDSMYLGRVGHSRSLVTATGTAVTVESTQDKPYVASVFELPCAALTTGGHSVLEKLLVQESVEADADVRRPALRAHIFNRLPTTPVANVVYVPQLDRHIGTIMIEAGVAEASDQWRKWRRISTKAHQAHVRADLDLPAYSGESSIWLVLVADATVTPAAATSVTVHAAIRKHT